MARKKPLNVYPVKTLEDANEALEQIASLRRFVEAEELIMNEQIDQLKAETEMKTMGNLERIKSLENGLQAFCEFNKAELFKRRRSVDLIFGIIGFRKATKLAPLPKITWARIVEIMEEKGLMSGVRVKKSANKEVMGEWSDEKLGQVNARRVVSDDFWYEIKEENVTSLRQVG